VALLYDYVGLFVRRQMSPEIILVCEAPAANATRVPDPHVSIFVVIPVLPNRIKSLVAFVAPVSELIEMPQHVLLHVLLVHESSEAEITDRSVRVFHHVVIVEVTVLAEGGTAHIAVVDVALALLDVAEEDELVDEQLFAAQALVVRNVHLFVGADEEIVRRGEVGDDVATLRLGRPGSGLSINYLTGGGLQFGGEVLLLAVQSHVLLLFLLALFHHVRDHVAVFQLDYRQVVVRLVFVLLLRRDILLDDHLVDALGVVEDVQEFVVVRDRTVMFVVQDDLLYHLLVLLLLLLLHEDGLGFVLLQMAVKLRCRLVFAAAFAAVEGLTVLVQVVLEKLVLVRELRQTYVTSVIHLGLFP
jgi:hypothetical protein